MIMAMWAFVVGLFSIVILALIYMGFCLFGYYLNSSNDTDTFKYHPIRFGVGVLGAIGILSVVGAITGFGIFVLGILKVFP